MVSNILEIISRLKTLNLPIAHRAFKEPMQPPFICYLVDNIKTEGADNKQTLLKRYSVTVELYTQERDFTLENQILNLFDDVEVSADDAYIESENLNVTYFEFEFYEK